MHQFDVQFGLPDPTFTKVNQSGGTALPAADSGDHLHPGEAGYGLMAGAIDLKLFAR